MHIRFIHSFIPKLLPTLFALIRKNPLNPEDEAAFQQQFRQRSYEITIVVTVIGALAGTLLNGMRYLGASHVALETDDILLRMVTIWGTPTILILLRSQAERWYTWIIAISLSINLLVYSVIDIVANADSISLARTHNEPRANILTLYVTTLISLSIRTAGLLALANLVIFAIILGIVGTTDTLSSIIRIIAFTILGLSVCWIIEARERHLFSKQLEAERQQRLFEAEKVKVERLLEQYNATRDAALQEIKMLRQDAVGEQEKRLRFIRDILHDIKNPLMAFGINMDNYRRAKLIGRDDLANEAASSLDSAYNAVSTLTEDLFELSNYEMQQFNKKGLRSISVNEVLSDLAHAFTERANAKCIRLQLKLPQQNLYCLSDGSALQRILINLTANAIKFTPQRSGWRPRIAIGAVKRPYGFIDIYVRDSGIGIEQSRLDVIWDYGVTTTGTKNEKGHGIGLAVVKAICNAIPDHSLTLTSRIGHGSCFILSVPLIDPRDTDSESTGTTASLTDLQGLTVLVVDDDVEVLASESLLLKLLGAKPILADSVLSACQACVNSDHRPDLIVTDFHLRDGEKGTDVLAEVRGANNACIPAIIATVDEIAAIEAVQDLQNVEVLCKPLMKESLLRLARNYLAILSA